MYSESEAGEILAEHSGTKEPIELYISDILSQPMPVIEYDLGTDTDWPQRIDQLEREILESERKFSQSLSSMSKVISSSSSSEDERDDVFSERVTHSRAATMDSVLRMNSLDINTLPRHPPASPGSRSTSTKHSVASLASSSNDVFEVDFKHSPERHNVLTSTRSHLTSSSSSSSDDMVMATQTERRSSSSSSSSSDGPTRTLAEVDLSVPLTQQIGDPSLEPRYMHDIGNVSGELRGSHNKILVISSSSTSLNTLAEEEEELEMVGTMTRVEEWITTATEAEDNSTPVASPAPVHRAMKVQDYQSSEDDSTPKVVRKMTPFVGQMTPVVAHSSSSSSSSDSDDSVRNMRPMTRISEEDNLDLAELILTDHGHEKPKIKQMRGSGSLAVPR